MYHVLFHGADLALLSKRFEQAVTDGETPSAEESLQLPLTCYKLGTIVVGKSNTLLRDTLRTGGFLSSLCAAQRARRLRL